jgi:hypothetical protein
VRKPYPLPAQARKFERLVHPETARTLGPTIPPAVWGRVDKAIQ